MAVRLPLIVSQPARRDAASTEMIENIVAAALLVPRLDANLIGDLSTIESGSTDHLCLQGHGRDLIIASYLTLAEASSDWKRLGLDGQFIDCNLDAAQLRVQARQALSGRRVFYFQLTSATRITWLLDTCQELVNAQALQLVSIQLPIRPAVQEQSPAPLNPGQSQPAQSQPAPINSSKLTDHKPTDHKASQHTSVNAGAGQHSSVSPTITRPLLPLAARRQPDEDSEWAGLDQLVDDLDALDL